MKKQIRQLALKAGAVKVGFSPIDRFSGGPKSMDPTYLLPSAKSVISILIPLDEDIIRRYIAKDDHDSFQKHETEVYRKLYKIACDIRDLLKSKGFEAETPEPNNDYRFKYGKKYNRIPYHKRQKIADFLTAKTGKTGRLARKILVSLFYRMASDGVNWNLTPTFSQRYAAVACGLGSIGWSGNLMTHEYGSRVLLASVITNAELEGDPMVAENPCDRCKICARVCQAGMISTDRTDGIEIGGKYFEHNKKAHNLRCILVCAGFTGQSKYPDWSTWSPGRFKIPDDDSELELFWQKFIRDNLWTGNFYSRQLADLIFHTHYGYIRKPYERFRVTCGNCQIICWQNRKDRAKNYRILKSSGVISSDSVPEYRQL